MDGIRRVGLGEGELECKKIADNPFVVGKTLADSLTDRTRRGVKGPLSEPPSELTIAGGVAVVADKDVAGLVSELTDIVGVLAPACLLVMSTCTTFRKEGRPLNDTSTAGLLDNKGLPLLE